MPASDLKETTMSKKTRSLIQVQLVNKENTDKIFDNLMGKDAQARFRFIRERAAFVQNDLDV
jgi:DNA gyrase subunit B